MNTLEKARAIINAKDDPEELRRLFSVNDAVEFANWIIIMEGHSEALSREYYDYGNRILIGGNQDIRWHDNSIPMDDE